MSSRSRRVLAGTVLAIVLAMAGGNLQPATAADSAIVIADESPEVEVTPYWSGGSTELPSCESPQKRWRPFGDRKYDHRLSVLLRNDSPESRTLSLALVSRDGVEHPMELCGTSEMTPGQSSVVVARAPALDDAALGAVLVVTATAGESTLSAAATTDTSVLPHAAKYWSALIFAVFAGALVSLVGAVMCRAGLNQPIKSDKGWKFGESWATAITAAGAVLTTALGASGLLEELAPTVNGPRVVALGLAFGALALLAPIAMTATARFTLEATDQANPDHKTAQTKPTGWSLLAGGALTIIGVYGQLTLFALILGDFDTDTGTQSAGAFLVFVALAMIAIYAWRTWYALTVLDETSDGTSGTQAVPPAL